MPRSPGRPAPAARPVRPSALRPGARPGGRARHTRPVRRASAGLTPVRAGALLALLTGIAAIYGLASSDAFSARRTVITGATWTSDEAILTALALPGDSNVFTIRTGDLEAALHADPAIRGATVTIALPDEVRVAVVEREALLAWKVGDQRFLVDGEGRLFATLGPAAPASAESLPVIDDARTASMSLVVGSTLDPVTLDAALRLASLTPANVGSAAQTLVLRIDDVDGFTMRTRPDSWDAVFGFYTPTLRTTDLIPGQVRLLAALLSGREPDVKRVILADDHSSTYVPRETPAATETPKPTKVPKPVRTPKPAGTPTPTPTPRP